MVQTMSMDQLCLLLLGLPQILSHQSLRYSLFVLCPAFMCLWWAAFALSQKEKMIVLWIWIFETHFENGADGWNVDIRIIEKNRLCFGESTGVIWSCLPWEDLLPTLRDWAQILPRWSLGITVNRWLTLILLLASLCLWLCIFCLLDLINLMTNSRKWNNSQVIPLSHFDTSVLFIVQ